MEDKKGSVKQKGNFWNHDRKDALKGYLLIFPSILLLGIFTIYPIFTCWTPASGWKPLSKGVCRPGKLYHSVQKCGFSHDSEKYVYLFRWSGGNLMVLATLLAVWVNGKAQKRLNSVTLAAVFTPHIISLVSVSTVFLWIMDPQIGAINYVLRTLG